MVSYMISQFACVSYEQRLMLAFAVRTGEDIQSTYVSNRMLKKDRFSLDYAVE
jgi:hypothetical protein